MSHSDAHDFTKLYRAAFAERDPEKKLILLGQVQQAIESWQRSDEVSLPSSKIPPQSVRAPLALSA